MTARRRPATPQRTAKGPRVTASEVREIWDANSEFWDAQMGDGNLTHQHLVAPAMERLLNLQRGEEVLDIACGNGQFSRRLASLGARVVAIDLSEGMLVQARARSRKFVGKIDYRRQDATDPRALRNLGAHRFSAVVSSMALMDMAEIGPLASALRGLLKERGRFVFAVTHPCFNGSGTRRVKESEDQEGVMVERAGVFVFRYGTPTTTKGLAMIGQPRPQFCFDRPLHELLRPFFTAGMVLDGLEEPRFPIDVPENRSMSTIGFREIPWVLAVRLRFPSASG